ncbi:unnamed protein product [Moneuplotes crassus]|uniref:Peptidyl-prolyl cis-trans isomerase n=1 Tax=Euplotes crassus TaxID=5936 RepID=A0AAD2D6D1_EUPCR|nr:unnamed protein product [Moneuplotes crassus]
MFSRLALRKFSIHVKTTHKVNPFVYMDISIDNQHQGRITYELFNKHVPRTSKNFLELCRGDKEKLTYKNSPFHRIIPGLLIQGGDIVNLDGTGGTSIYGDTFYDENYTFRHEGPGYLSMANNGVDTNSSQFFITTEAAPFYDYKNVVFGRVTDGMDLVEEIETYGNTNGSVNADIRISDCGVLSE